MIPLTNKENQSYHCQGICYIYKQFNTDNRRYYKVRDNNFNV